MNKAFEALEKHPTDVQERFYYSSLRDEYNASLYLTAKFLLGYKDINPYTHGDMIHALESNVLRKLLVMPRGSLKTSLGSVAYAIWSLNKEPNLRIMLDSELYSNSKNISLLELLMNKKYLNRNW